MTLADARADARRRAFDLAFLFVAKAAIGAYVLRTGFSHVSDDDYARVVIAQSFAHAPAFDPSGTSWLPFPFWLSGGAMMVLGRSLDAARAIAFALGVVSVAFPYAAMRAVGCGRATALGAVIVAMALPWNAWLGVATVPEAMTACLIAAGAIATASRDGKTRVVGASCLFAAALSRYEAWPVCAVMAAACAVGLLRVASPGRLSPANPHPPAPSPARGEGERTAMSPPLSPGGRGAGGEGARETGRESAQLALALIIAIAGPLAWMAWNAHAHGSATHFVARVAAYRQAMGAASQPLAEKLAAFPRAVVVTSPMIVGLAAIGSIAFVIDPAVRARWSWPLASAIALLAFLAYGDASDGAPTHHPERAVIPVLWILAAFAADALRALATRVAWARPAREMWVVGAGMAGVIAWGATLPARLRDHPASASDESRDIQIARGLALPPDAHIRVTPCAYEHFALIAAFAAPERADIAPSSPSPVTPRCPRVEIR